MPANQGEWVVSVFRAVFDKLAVCDKLKFVGLVAGLLPGAEIFASN